ncbi:MAG: P-II family nitrogen regulator [Planctomycetota bacterium]
MLKKIECFLQPFTVDDLKDYLIRAGVVGMSITDVKGFGRRAAEGKTNSKDVEFVTRTKVEIVVDEESLDAVMALIRKHADTGGPDAGKIFVLPVEEAVRISTRETGRNAIL